MNKFKLISIVFGLCSIELANAIEAPSYNEVLAAQLKCNTQYFSGPLWDKKNPILAKMDKGTVAIIAKPVITELPLKPFKSANPDFNDTKDRSFKVDAIVYDFFSCGVKKTIDPKIGKGSPTDTYIDIFETKKAAGMFCVVLMEDFLKNSNAINVDKLCEGKSAKDREATKQGIIQARKAWKAIVAGKTK